MKSMSISMKLQTLQWVQSPCTLPPFIPDTDLRGGSTYYLFPFWTSLADSKLKIY